MEGDKADSDGPIFGVEAKPLIYTKVSGNYNSNPAIRRLEHTSVCEAAIHFWRKGLSSKEMLSKVDYSCPKELPTK